uniref:Uncharacterized protein n=1 Tax=Arundo donax TaxID=35708 RepID=A0A0A9HIG2_ARUDO
MFYLFGDRLPDPSTFVKDISFSYYLRDRQEIHIVIPFLVQVIIISSCDLTRVAYVSLFVPVPALYAVLWSQKFG